MLGRPVAWPGGRCRPTPRPRGGTSRWGRWACRSTWLAVLWGAGMALNLAWPRGGGSTTPPSRSTGTCGGVRSFFIGVIVLSAGFAVLLVRAGRDHAGADVTVGHDPSSRRRCRPRRRWRPLGHLPRRLLNACGRRADEGRRPDQLAHRAARRRQRRLGLVAREEADALVHHARQRTERTPGAPEPGGSPPWGSGKRSVSSAARATKPTGSSETDVNPNSSPRHRSSRRPSITSSTEPR